MDKFEYINGIDELTEDMVSRAMEQSGNDIEAAEKAIFGHMLHETIADGHQWVISYGSAGVLRHSHNRDAWKGDYSSEDIDKLTIKYGVKVLNTLRAYHAMYYDVAERVPYVIEQYVIEETDK